MKTKVKKQLPRKLTSKERLKELEDLIGICFALLSEYDFKEVANLTTLSLSTINRLYAGTYSLNIRWGTIQKLTAASGLKITTTEYGVTIRLVD